MSVILLGNAAIHYESLGRGRPVVFLHTWVGSWRYWVPAMQLASAAHGTYALDLLGFGDSARLPGGYSIQQQADLIRGFLDEMGIDRIALVAHGLGALAALRFAAEHTARVARLLAVCMPREPAALDGRLNSSTPQELVALLAGSLPGGAENLGPAILNDPPAMRTIPDAGQTNADLDALRVAGLPCLLVYGAEDVLVAAPSSDNSVAPGAHFGQIVLDDAGHFPMIDASDSFNRLMVDFLALETGGSPRELKLREEWRRRIR